MKPRKYIRKKNAIRHVVSDRIDTFKSTNQAKRASFKLQKETDGGLGRGSLRKVL